jgi:acyl-CoA thioester hydrolase
MRQPQGLTNGAGRHCYRLRVYFEDTDAAGIVYHARYLGFAERARTELLRDLGVPHAELLERHGLRFVVRRVRVEYRRPARLDDLLEVLTEPVAMGAASVALRQALFRVNEDTPLTVIDLGLAVVRRTDQRPARLPERWREAFLRWGQWKGKSAAREVRTNEGV